MTLSRITSFFVSATLVFGLAACAAETEETTSAGPEEHQAEHVAQTSDELTGLVKAKPFTIDPVPGGNSGGYSPPCPGGTEPPWSCPSGTVVCGCYCRTLAQCKAERLQ